MIWCPAAATRRLPPPSSAVEYERFERPEDGPRSGSPNGLIWIGATWPASKSGLATRPSRLWSDSLGHCQSGLPNYLTSEEDSLAG